MNNVNLNSTVEEFNVNDKVVLRINPADPEFVTRFNAAFKDLNAAQTEFSEAVQTATDENFFDIATAANTKMRKIINELFGEDVCTPIWGTMHLTAISDGLPQWFNLMMALVESINNSTKKVTAIRNKRLDAYLAKYQKK